MDPILTVIRWSKNIASIRINQEYERLCKKRSSLKYFQKTKIFIPMVIEGVRDHIVGIVVDLENKRIELYDPKGMTALDRSGEKLKGSTYDLEGAIQLISQEYGITDIYENTRKDQYDCNNCGAFVIEYFRQRSEGKSAEEVNPFAEKKSYFSTIQTIRVAITEKIIGHKL